MYRQQSLITLDQFHGIRLLTKLEAILNFVDFSLLENTFPICDCKRSPKGYSKKQSLSVLLVIQTEQMASLKALVQKLKSDLIVKRTCVFDYFDPPPQRSSFKPRNYLCTNKSVHDFLVITPYFSGLRSLNNPQFLRSFKISSKSKVSKIIPSSSLPIDFTRAPVLSVRKEEP